MEKEKALFEMEYVLRYQKGNLTANEENLLQRRKLEAVRGFMSGALVFAGVACAATWKLSRFARTTISGGAAALFGFWRFGKTLDSSVDHILGMDGSRMQKELAHILATKYQDDPWTFQQLNKRFYPEKVYDDSNSERPIIRLRYRNFYGENVALGKRVHGGDSLDVLHNDSMNPGANIIEDPLENSFGSMAPVEEIHHLPTGRVLTHSHRRSHPRRRMHHHRASVDRKQDQQQQVKSC